MFIPRSSNIVLMHSQHAIAHFLLVLCRLWPTVIRLLHFSVAGVSWYIHGKYDPYVPNTHFPCIVLFVLIFGWTVSSHNLCTNTFEWMGPQYSNLLHLILCTSCPHIFQPLPTISLPYPKKIAFNLQWKLSPSLAMNPTATHRSQLVELPTHIMFFAAHSETIW